MTVLTTTVQRFGKTRGMHRWAERAADGETLFGCGKQCLTVATIADADVSKIQAWIDGAIFLDQVYA